MFFLSPISVKTVSWSHILQILARQFEVLLNR